MAPTNINLEFLKHEIRKAVNGDVCASYRIKKPSDLPSPFRPSVLPKVRLDLKRIGNDFLFNIMLNIHHKNILHLEAIQAIPVGDEKLLGLFVEPHDGPLIANLKHLVADKTTLVIPSQAFRDIVRQIIDGIEELRLNRLYHGAVSVENIYYSMKDHVIIVKLANFRQRLGADLEVAQLLDWVELGHVLTYIANAARHLNNDFSCAMIDRLALKLQRLIDTALLPNLKNAMLDDPFFWGTRKRTNFYIHKIEEALEDPTFLQRVRAYMHWQLPWKNNPHDGIVAAMDDHRKEVLHKDPYNEMDPVDNIKW